MFDSGQPLRKVKLRGKDNFPDSAIKRKARSKMADEEDDDVLESWEDAEESEVNEQ